MLASRISRAHTAFTREVVETTWGKDSGMKSFIGKILLANLGGGCDSSRHDLPELLEAVTIVPTSGGIFEGGNSLVSFRLVGTKHCKPFSNKTESEAVPPSGCGLFLQMGGNRTLSLDHGGDRFEVPLEKYSMQIWSSSEVDI